MAFPAMLHKFVTLATLIPMLLHSILGCCWHHDHCEIVVSPGSHAASCELHPGDNDAGSLDRNSGCDHHSSVGDNRVAACADNCQWPADHQGTPHEPCGEDRCVYVGFPLGELSKLTLATGVGGTSEDAVRLLSPMAIVCSHRHGEQPPQTLLSTRARTQVWLI